MSLSSVSWVWMCVFLYIQNSEAAIRGFLPKNTDVEKTERAQEIFDSTHWQNEEIYLLNSLSLCFVPFIFVGFWTLNRSSNTAAMRPATHRWRHNSGESKGQMLPCAASNKCDIFGRGNTKSLALRFCYSGSFTDSTNSLLDSVKQLVDLLSWTANDWSRKCDPPRPLHLTDGTFLKQGQQEERVYLHHHHHGHVMLFLEEGQQTPTTIQPCTHWPQKERDTARQRRVCPLNVWYTWP